MKAIADLYGHLVVFMRVLAWLFVMDGLAMEIGGFSDRSLVGIGPPAHGLLFTTAPNATTKWQMRKIKQLKDPHVSEASTAAAPADAHGMVTKRGVFQGDRASWRSRYVTSRHMVGGEPANVIPIELHVPSALPPVQAQCTHCNAGVPISCCDGRAPPLPLVAWHEARLA